MGAFVITASQLVGLLVKRERSTLQTKALRSHGFMVCSKNVLHSSPECFSCAEAFIVKNTKLHEEKV